MLPLRVAVAFKDHSLPPPPPFSLNPRTSSPRNPITHPIMSYNLRADAKGRQGRRSNANVVVVSSEVKSVEGEGMDDIEGAASLNETGESTAKKKSHSTVTVRERVAKGLNGSENFFITLV